MAGRRLTITLDEPLLDALHGEGARTCEPASRVAERVLRAALPDYVAGELRRDLTPVVRARVLDVRSTPADDPSDAQRPGLNPGRSDDFCQDAEPRLSPGRPEPEPGGASAAR